MKAQWTREAPTVAGWYWLHFDGYTECVCTYMAGAGMLVETGDDIPANVRVLTKNGAYWMPADIPEPPQESNT